MSKLPFKMRQKYVLERKIEGDEVFLVGTGDSVTVYPDSDAEVDLIMADQISDDNFVLEGVARDKKFYATDLLIHDGRIFIDEPWNQRYKALKNGFDWNNFIKVNRPLVVTEEEEMREAAELLMMIDDTEGVVVRGYSDVYGDQRYVVDGGAVDV